MMGEAKKMKVGYEFLIMNVVALLDVAGVSRALNL